MFVGVRGRRAEIGDDARPFFLRGRTTFEPRASLPAGGSQEDMPGHTQKNKKYIVGEIDTTRSPCVSTRESIWFDSMVAAMHL